MNAAAKAFDGENKYIRITDIDEGLSIYNDSDVVSPDGILSDNYLVKERDILLARTGASTGKSYLYRKTDGKLYYAGFLIRANITDHSPYFVFAQLHTHRYWKWISTMSARSGQPGINSQEYASFPISTTSIQEENKIARFLSLLDGRIATQNKIIEELKKLKNGISLNLFTNRIIFDKQITLSKCGTLRNGYAFKSSTYNLKGKYSIITIANVTGSRFIESVDCNKVTQIPEDIQSHQILSNGDILISLTGNVGRVSLCTDGHFLLNQRVGLFELSDSIDKEFIYQVLSSKHFENEMIAKGQGAAQMNINKNDVESYVIPYSTNLQNIRIVSSLLKSLDEKILTMEHLLLSYNKQKTYLLRHMFI